MEWRQETHRNGVGALHALGVPGEPQRLVRWCLPERSALVLGSAQLEDVVDGAAARRLGVDVVKRRSGGGAVLVEPGDLIWVDVFVPASDPLWRADVGQAFWWLGEVWATALASLTELPLEVHHGPLMSNEWSRLVCFAGLGPGEVTVNGRKVVGISQRRTRSGALFQCALFRHFRVERLRQLLQLSGRDGDALIEMLSRSIVTSADVDEKALVASFSAALPGP